MSNDTMAFILIYVVPIIAYILGYIQGKRERSRDA